MSSSSFFYELKKRAKKEKENKYLGQFSVKKLLKIVLHENKISSEELQIRKARLGI